MVTEMIERVAKAHWDASKSPLTREWDDCAEYFKETMRDRARAAIAAMREPTEAMVTAGKAHTDTYYSKDGDFALGWNAACDAALA